MTDERAGVEPLPVAASRDGGRYTLLSMLGRGGMGEVYLARDERLRRQVAIKRIRAAGEDDEQLRARLEQEARVLAQLGHPAIVAVFDIFEDADGAWVVMELVVGRTLAKMQDARPLDVDDVLAHGIAIAAALDSAHQKGIVHRDLKVENVMVSESGQIKILDFGLAKRLLPSESTPALSIEGQVMGTVRTMSPEQARGLAVDERSDLFSLGVLLYELLSGTSPFAGATAVDTLVRVSTHRQTSLVELPGLEDRIPPALSALVDELLEKAVEQRPESAAEVRDRLQAIVDARPPVVRKGPPRATPPRGQWAILDQQPTLAPTSKTAPLKQPAAGPAASQPAPETVVAKPRRTADQVATAPTAVAATALAVVGEGPSSPATSAPPRRIGRRYLALAGLGVAVAAGSAVLLLRTGEGRGTAAASDAGSAGSTAPPLRGSAEPQSDPKAEYERGMALLRNYHREGAIEQAVGIFQRMLRKNDRSAPAYAGLARAYWLQYKVPDSSSDPVFLQQAQAAAERAVALDEFLVDARVSRGFVAFEAKQIEQAEQHFKAASALDSKSADVHDGLAQLHIVRNQLDEATAEFRKAIELDPGNREFYDDLGALLVMRGKYEDAIPLFEKSIELAPDSVYGYSNLGGLYGRQGRYTEAAQRLQDALKIRPSSSLYTNLGTVLFAQGLYGPAATAFERALAMGGAAHNHVNWGNLADAYRQLPDAMAKAREHYDRAIEMIDEELIRSPKSVTLMTRRALYLAKRGDCPRATTGLATLADVRDPPVYALYRMAVTRELCGQRAPSLGLLERALAGGFEQAEIDQDPDLRALRADPDYMRRIHGRRGPAPAK